MHKSSVYLPDELKRRLADVATRSGRSEADLIRTAIERLVVSQADAREPAKVPFTRPCVIGVGVGPGDPAHVTALAVATLSDADRVIVLTTDEHSVGRAEMVVRAVAPATRIVRVPFAIGADPVARQDSIGPVVTAALAGADAGELVAVAVLGDASQWTVFPIVAGALSDQRPDLVVEAVAGVASYQAVAGRGTVALGSAGGTLAVVDNVADLDELLGRAATTVVLFKASTDAETLQRVAAAHGRDGLVGELTGLPGERVSRLTELAPGPISYLATVVFPLAQAPA